MRESEEIVSETDLSNLTKWNTNTDPNDTNQYWNNLSNGIIKTLEYKFPKTKINATNNDKTLEELRNNRTNLNYEIFKQKKEISDNTKTNILHIHFRNWINYIEIMGVVLPSKVHVECQKIECQHVEC